MKYSLTELIDVHETRKLLENFHDAVGIPAAIIDLQGVVLVTSQWHKACVEFHRANEITRRRCIQSDTILANSLLEGKTYCLYRCQNGLMDAASPIIIEGEHLANMFIGQFLTEKPDLEFFRAQAKENGFEEAAYLNSIANLPVVAEDTLPALLSFLTSFAVMIGKLGLKQLKQVQIESELREAEKDLKRAQAVAKVGNWRIIVPENVIHWSDEVYRMFGIPHLTPVNYEIFVSTIHPDDREKVDRAWQAALHGEPYDIEHRIIVGDAVKWVREQAELEFYPDGELSGAFGTVQDITDQKHAEQELLRAKNDWERTFNSVPDLIAILDNDHRIVRANRQMAERLGVKPEKCVGMHCYQPVHGLNCPLHNCPHSMTLKDGEEHTSEVHEERLGGDYLVSTTPLHDDKGMMIGTVHVARNITDRKRMEEELRKSRDELEFRVQERTSELSEALHRLELMNQELQDFAHIASHDLQEPLRKIQAFGDRLRSSCEEKLDETESDYLMRLGSAANRMQHFIRDLLNLSRIATRLEPLMPVDLNEIVAKVAETFEYRLRVNHGVLEFSGLPVLEADATQMQQLFQNLIGNALKFQKDGEPPHVRVCSSCNGNNCEIVVEDNGIGFEEKYLNRIFSPFQRLHGKGTYEGTGMGLAICRKIVERHGGNITAQSVPGKGSKFIVTLPARNNSGVGAEPPRSSTSPA